MLGAIEKRFGDKVPEQSIQWLTDITVQRIERMKHGSSPES